MSSITHLLYLHGFRSSPKSFKARFMADWLRWPAERMGVIGSSLGGFYATVVAERTGCRAVLLNPAVNPARDLAGHIGELTSFHDPDDHFYFKPEYVTQLRVLTPRAITHPERYLPVIAKGDEVLDWREMSERYDSAPMRLLDGGDHAMTAFDEELPHILGFLGLTD
jgi:uncharacterized protein